MVEAKRNQSFSLTDYNCWCHFLIQTDETSSLTTIGCTAIKLLAGAGVSAAAPKALFQFGGGKSPVDGLILPY